MEEIIWEFRVSTKLVFFDLEELLNLGATLGDYH